MFQRKRNENKKSLQRIQKRGFLLPKISMQDKSNFEDLKNQIFQEIQQTKLQRSTTKIWNKQSSKLNMQQEIFRKFDRKSKSVANIYAQENTDKAKNKSQRMRSKFFRKDQIKDINGALKLVNQRMKGKFTENQQKESNFNLVQKAKEIYLIKRTIYTIQQEIQIIKDESNQKTQDINLFSKKK